MKNIYGVEHPEFGKNTIRSRNHSFTRIWSWIKKTNPRYFPELREHIYKKLF